MARKKVLFQVFCDERGGDRRRISFMNPMKFSQEEWTRLTKVIEAEVKEIQMDQGTLLDKESPE